jgi:hypothetical protein
VIEVVGVFVRFRRFIGIDRGCGSTKLPYFAATAWFHKNFLIYRPRDLTAMLPEVEISPKRTTTSYKRRVH